MLPALCWPNRGTVPAVCLDGLRKATQNRVVSILVGIRIGHVPVLLYLGTDTVDPRVTTGLTYEEQLADLQPKS
jgi:hypothetical protein